MPTSPSTRLALVGPAGTDTIAQGDDQIRAIITQLEAVGAGFQQGTSRPAAAAALAGYFYINTSTGLVSYCTGSVWLDFQAHDSDLDSIAALSTTSFGRSLLTAAAAANLPGGEIGYDQITSNFTVTGSFSTVIAGSAYTFDGAPVIAEFFTPGVDAPPSNAQVQICLFEGATNLGMLAQITNPSAGFMDVPVLGRSRFTPSAGAHTYSVKAVRTGASNGTLYADTGASGAHLPAYLRFTKA